ncbi:MAG: ribonuclease D [Planctomycetota bacterium]|jgi:ribonuclease D
MDDGRNFQYIDNDEDLATLCTSMAQASYCTIDTEFIREKTYYPILALIQIATDQQQACIDPLVIKNFQPLIDLLLNEQLLKIFHSCSQDLEILYQEFACLPVPVFDTQIAAAVVGYNHQASYADLVHQITGVKLEKKHTRADWSRRPLSEDELDYAMDDVRYLLPVYESLVDQLKASNRLGWLDKDLKALSNTERYEVDMSLLWKRLKGVQKLKGLRLQIASDLCQWRETIAQQANRPRRWILKDEVIADIAKRCPENIEELKDIRDLGDKMIERHGVNLLEIIAKAKLVDSSLWPHLDKLKELSVQQQVLGDCLMALCRFIADQNNIALATLATRKDIDNLIINQKSSRLMQGWQFEMAGEQLLNFIHGQTTVAVGENGIEFRSD